MSDRQAQATIDALAARCALDPDNSLAQIDLGMALLADGRAEPAIAAFDHAILAGSGLTEDDENDPDVARAIAGKGLALVRLRRDAEALALLKRSLSLGVPQSLRDEIELTLKGLDVEGIRTWIESELDQKASNQD